MLRRRWPFGSKVLIGLAVMFAGGAFVVVRGYQARVEALHPLVGPPVATVTAATDLARGTVLSEEMLRTSTVPEEFVPPGAVGDTASLVGRVLTANVQAGEILTRSRLAGAGIGPVAALVPEGLRAVIVPSGVPPGTVRAGDRIDLYATYGGGRPHTELVASGLEVVRIITEGSAGGTGIGGTPSADAGVSLVLLVDGDAAARLAYARAFGQLLIAIVGPSPSPSTA
jgi:pilus assembly protein CpaB